MNLTFDEHVDVSERYHKVIYHTHLQNLIGSLSKRSNFAQWLSYESILILVKSHQFVVPKGVPPQSNGAPAMAFND